LVAREERCLGLHLHARFATERESKAVKVGVRVGRESIRDVSSEWELDAEYVKW
jgi:hypothetical protein